ncbi:MAG: amidase [Burkholderiales bacterium]|nr:MAG: amidase [Burkholderiales bacterium]
MSPDTYAALGATEIARRVAAREASAREVVDAALARIAATEPRLNAFVHVDADGARRAADALDAALRSGAPAGPLAGVPVSVKDLVHVAGMPTSSGSLLFAGAIAGEDAAPVARLRAAGAIIVGKTTTPEFGHKPITSAPLFGETLNPWNPAFTCGGSSGGAAVSVAARQVPLAVGTDGGGSIRIPASACGVLGLKPTLGRVPHVHAPDLFGNNAYIGPMARTLEDLEAVYRVMAGPDARDPWSRAMQIEHEPGDAARSAVRFDAPGAGIGSESQGAPDAARRLRVGCALTVGNPVVEPQVADAFERAVALAQALGLVCEPVAIDLASTEPAFRTLLESALAARFGSRLATDRDRLDPSFVRTVENGLARTGPEVAAAHVLRSTLYRQLEALFERFDLLLTPTLSQAALPAFTDPHAEVRIAGRDCGPIRAGWYPYTFPLNLSGHPALSLPCGWTDEGLPIGLQVVGGWAQEARIFAVARLLIEALHFQQPAPDS